MPAVTTHPHWSSVIIKAPTSLLSGALTTGVLDLRNAEGARVWLTVGKGGSAQPSTAVNITIRPQIAAGAQTAGGRGLANSWSANANRTSTIASTLVSAAAWVNSGVAALPVKAAGAAIVPGTTVGIANANLTRYEIAKVFHRRPVATASTLTMDAPLLFAHSATQDRLFNCAEQWMTTLVGGAQYRVTFKHPGTTGSPQIIAARAQVFYGIKES